PVRDGQFMTAGTAYKASRNCEEGVRRNCCSASESPLSGARLLLPGAGRGANGWWEEAREVGARFGALRRGFSLDTYARTRLPFFDPALREAFAAHLRQAGVPE